MPSNKSSTSTLTICEHCNKEFKRIKSHKCKVQKEKEAATI